jgi:hypothetical protein
MKLAPIGKAPHPLSNVLDDICVNHGAKKLKVSNIWKAKLEPKLGFNGAGCNVARRAAVDTARRAHGKRKMSEAEIQEEVP